MDTGCPGVLKTGRKSNPDCACAKLRGRVTVPSGVPVTEARVTKSPVMGNYHAGFGSMTHFHPPSLTHYTQKPRNGSSLLGNPFNSGY